MPVGIFNTASLQMLQNFVFQLLSLDFLQFSHCCFTLLLVIGSTPPICAPFFEYCICFFNSAILQMPKNLDPHLLLSC